MGRPLGSPPRPGASLVQRCAHDRFEFADGAETTPANATLAADEAHQRPRWRAPRSRQTFVRVTNPLRDGLNRQLHTAWQLTSLHFQGLTTEECLWRPAGAGPHVLPSGDGSWVADWPEHEGYDLGPPSIAWVTWHIGFWWSMVLDHSFGAGTLSRQQVRWPGSADAARVWIEGLHRRWTAALGSLDDDQWQSAANTRWPFQGRPFSDVVAWVNLELMKNAAEIGYARFLYAVRRSGNR